MKIELKKISFSERMSEETNCFVADLYVNVKCLKKRYMNLNKLKTIMMNRTREYQIMKNGIWMWCSYATYNRKRKINSYEARKRWAGTGYWY